MLKQMLCLLFLVISGLSSQAQVNFSTDCDTGTANLTGVTAANQPAGTTLTWHTATPATSFNRLSDVTTVAPGTYYAAFYDATENCYSNNTSTVTVTTSLCIENSCPATTVNLTTAISNTNLPAGATLTWHTDTPATTANLVATPTAVAAGNYYAAFYDAINNCFSPTSTITATTSVCPTALISGSGSTCQSSDTISIALTGTQPWSITYTDGTTPTTVTGITTSPYSFAVAPTTTVTYTLTAVSDAKATGTFSGSATFNRKIWNGSVDTDWKNPSNWMPAGIPINTDYVVIPPTANNPIILGSGYNAYACVLLVKNGASLNSYSNNSITVTNQVIVETTGTFQIDNNASLVQINNVANTGTIIFKRISNVRNLDYVYWSSPVFGMNISNLITPLTFGPIYKWNPTIANTNGGEGDWESATSESMDVGKGYIARAPSSFDPIIAQPLEAIFTGTPNNGIVNCTISRGTDTDTNYHQGVNGIEIDNFNDNWNLIGNPYPSAIRASQFLLDNVSSIEGSLNLWTHGTLPSNTITNPFYSSFAYNYTPNDYITYNFTGTSCCPLAPDDLFIGAGQGFFVQMIDGTEGSGSITFNNALRNASYSNALFYKTTNLPKKKNTIDVNAIQRNRIWLDIVSSDGESDRTLFGYIEGASMDYDSLFDSYTMVSESLQVYSVIADKIFLIQGRQLPFSDDDEVPIGINIPADGEYSISIAGTDGLFATQNIYLKDQFLNTIHNLKQSPYSFKTISGTINNRFKIIYKNNTLNNPNYDFDSSIQISSDTYISVTSSLQPIKDVVVFDILGRKIREYKKVNTNQIRLMNLQKTNTILLVKVTLQNDVEGTKKVNF